MLHKWITFYLQVDTMYLVLPRHECMHDNVHHNNYRWRTEMKQQVFTKSNLQHLKLLVRKEYMHKK